jgi:hypothetical protein
MYSAGHDVRVLDIYLTVEIQRFGPRPRPLIMESRIQAYDIFEMISPTTGRITYDGHWHDRSGK